MYFCINIFRRSERNNKGQPPERFTDLLNIAKEVREPKTFREALTSSDAEKWRQAMTPVPLSIDYDEVFASVVRQLSGHS